jgi:hypothetical protein
MHRCIARKALRRAALIDRPIAVLSCRTARALRAGLAAGAVRPDRVFAGRTDRT